MYVFFVISYIGNKKGYGNKHIRKKKDDFLYFREANYLIRFTIKLRDIRIKSLSIRL